MSVIFLAEKLGCKDYGITFSRKPVMAKCSMKALNGDFINRGQVAGLHEKIMVTHTKIAIDLDLQMYACAKMKNGFGFKGYKNGEIINEFIDYGKIVNGDVGTVRILKDAILRCKESVPGLNQGTYIPSPFELLQK